LAQGGYQAGEIACARSAFEVATPTDPMC